MRHDGAVTGKESTQALLAPHAPGCVPGATSHKPKRLQIVLAKERPNVYTGLYETVNTMVLGMHECNWCRWGPSHLRRPESSVLWYPPRGMGAQSATHDGTPGPSHQGARCVWLV